MKYVMVNNFDEFLVKCMSENEISKIVIECCIFVHNELGPGLMESVCQVPPAEAGWLVPEPA